MFQAENTNMSSNIVVNFMQKESKADISNGFAEQLM